jgi:hypothetical protein
MDDHCNALENEMIVFFYVWYVVSLKVHYEGSRLIVKFRPLKDLKIVCFWNYK